MKRQYRTACFAFVCIGIVISFSNDPNKWLFAGVMLFIAMMFVFGASADSN